MSAEAAHAVVEHHVPIGNEQGSLGMGLPSARRLTDEFEIVSAAGVGTTVTVMTWIDREVCRGRS